MRWVIRIGLAVWVIGVFAVAVVLNNLRWRQGDTVLVLNANRGWGIHRIDVVLVGAAVVPVLIVALLWIIMELVGDR